MAGRFLILLGVVGVALFGALQIHDLHGRLDELRGFRVGIPATMLPADRPDFEEFAITYKGAKMRARHYPSSLSGTAAHADYFVIINGEGIVEAAFSTDDSNGASWAARHLENRVR